MPTQVKMEKKEKVMAALAASPPSLRGLSSGLDTCYWFARKQNRTNDMKDQRDAERLGVGAGGVSEGERGRGRERGREMERDGERERGGDREREREWDSERV